MSDDGVIHEKALPLWFNLLKKGNLFCWSITMFVVGMFVGVMVLMNFDIHYFLEPLPQLPQMGTGLLGQADASSSLFWSTFKELMYHLFAFIGFMYLIIVESTKYIYPSFRVLMRVFHSDAEEASKYFDEKGVVFGEDSIFHKFS